MVTRILARIVRAAGFSCAGWAISLGICGCASYTTPGGPADFKALGVNREALTDSSIAAALNRAPLAKFPCAIAAVRVQAPGYRSETARGWGEGSYSIVTTRDIEKDQQWDRLAKLPMVSSIAPINRLLLSPHLNSDMELRQAAAALHADMLLLYTIDTSFHVEDHAAPLTVVTLGLSPNQTAQVICTASAVLMDTRNGYVYGFAEATEKGVQLTSGWTTDSAVDDARKRTESKAFDKLVENLKTTWTGVVQRYASSADASRGGAI